jgi:hypothetical protein
VCHPRVSRPFRAEGVNHRTPKIRTDFPMLKVGNGKYSAPGSPVAN